MRHAQYETSETTTACDAESVEGILTTAAMVEVQAREAEGLTAPSLIFMGFIPMRIHQRLPIRVYLDGTRHALPCVCSIQSQTTTVPAEASCAGKAPEVMPPGIRLLDVFCGRLPEKSSAFSWVQAR